ncbi:hypothetical protein [Solimonas marina]|uniref:Uncharacterized protein n=1 Tax=Solimonas marina TaxID=2714601 RepID=A0A969WC22_9GAMM|nr:hypothetical protein [Solimonas marina]NKF23434.1 hypothetical protein [Solimonas marina]
MPASRQIRLHSAGYRCRILTLAVVAWLVSASASAADSLPSITADALELAVASQQASVPERPALYVGSTLKGAVLRDVRVWIDRQPVVRYQFSEAQARALNAGGLWRLAVLPGDGAAHHLVAEFRASQDDGQLQHQLIVAQLDRSLVGGAGVAQMLVIGGGGLLHHADLALASVGSDALAREADTLLAGGEPFAAAVRYALAPGVDPLRVQAARAALGLVAADAPTVPLLSQFNAVLAAGGDVDAGLKQVADGSAVRDVGLSVKDLANVTRGYRALRAGQHDEATTAFRAVRSPGPYSNAALLGLGWTYLVPHRGLVAAADIPLRPSGADAVAQARRASPFRYLQAVAEGAHADDVRAALVPWVELIGRDPLDPAVQEGMLVVPYALDHVGAHRQALDYYSRAVQKLEAARTTLKQAAADVDGGRELGDVDARDADARSGWSRQLVERRDDQLAVPVRSLIDAPAVAAALHDYRQLQEIDRVLSADEDRLDASGADLRARISALRRRVAMARDASAAQARAAMHDELARLDRQTSVYLAEAEFAIARLYDRAPHGDGS